jgi:RNA polymerase sigma-70 factor, ECF subfamily
VPTRANTQPAFGVYRAERDAAVADSTGLMVVTLEGARIAVMTSFLDPSILARFGLPRTLRSQSHEIAASGRPDANEIPAKSRLLA